MNTQLLFIQGAGEGGYAADKDLVASLQAVLGKQFGIHYTEIVPDESAADYGWLAQIGRLIDACNAGVIIAGHSFGASMLLKYLSENAVNKRITGVFCLATPFWDGDEDWQTGLQLPEDFSARLPVELPLYFYHCRDDEEVPFSHFGLYRKKIARAIFREIEKGGHQFNNDLTMVAKDIKSLYNIPGQ